MEFGLCLESRHSHIRKIRGRPPEVIKCERGPQHVYGGKPVFLVGDRMTPYFKCVLCGFSAVVWYPCVRDGKKI